MPPTNRPTTITIDGNATGAKRAAREAADAVREVGAAVKDTLGGASLSERAGDAFIELNKALAESRGLFEANAITAQDYRERLEGIAATAATVRDSLARSDAEAQAFNTLIGETGAALEKTKGGASAASLAFQELINQLDRVKLGLKEGALTQSQYEAELVGLKAAVQEVGQAHSLSAGEQRTFQRLLSQTTVTVRPATEAMAALETQVAVLKAQFNAGAIGASQFNAEMRTVTADLKQVAATTELSAAEQRKYNTLLTQTTTEVHPKAIQGIGNVRSAVASMATQMIGAQSSVGSLVGGLGLMAGGGEVALAVTLGATAIAVAIQKIVEAATRGKRETQELLDKLDKLTNRQNEDPAAQVAASSLRMLQLRQEIRQLEAEFAAKSGTVDAKGRPVFTDDLRRQIARDRAELAKLIAQNAEAEPDALKTRFGAGDELEKLLKRAEQLAQIRQTLGGTLTPAFQAEADAVVQQLEKQYQIVGALTDQNERLDKQAQIIHATDALTKSITGQREQQRTLTDAEKLDQKLIADQLERQRKEAERILRARSPTGGKPADDGDQPDPNGVPQRPAPEEEPRFTIPSGVGGGQTAGGFFSGEDAARLNAALETAGDAALAKIVGLKTEVFNLEAAMGDAAKQGAEDLFGAIIAGGQRAGDVLRSLLTQLAQLASHALFTSLFSGTIGGGIPGAPANPGTAGMGLGFATGGLVPGRGTGDTVPAMLTPGEYVLTPSAVRSIGVGQLHAWNAGRAPTMGGAIGGTMEHTFGGGMTVGLEPGLVARHLDAYLDTKAGRQKIASAAASRPRTLRDGLNDNG